MRYTDIVFSLFASLGEPFDITSWVRRLPLPHLTRGRESNDCYKYIRTQLNTCFLLFSDEDVTNVVVYA